MVRFAIDLEGRMARKETVTECDVDAMMRHYRLEQEASLGESFGTIAAYGPNAAMMHYHPTPENCATLKPEGFLLVDCGGHYMEGTTDITRTYAPRRAHRGGEGLLHPRTPLTYRYGKGRI